MEDGEIVFVEPESSTFHFNAELQSYIFYMIIAIMCSIIYKVYIAAVYSSRPKNIEQVIADNVELANKDIQNTMRAKEWINIIESSLYFMRRLYYAILIPIILFVIHSLNKTPDMILSTCCY